MTRIFVTRELPGRALARLKETHDTIVWPEQTPPAYEQLRELTAEVDGLLSLLTDRVDADLMDAAPRLRVVANYAVGYDNIDVEAATERRIVVGHTPDVLTDATADLAFALLMAMARRITDAATFARTGGWRTWNPTGFLGAEVYGQTLGVIGSGRIGQAVASRARGYGMETVMTRKDDTNSFNELLARSDFVSVHLPLTPSTHGLIGRAAFELMKPTAILVNTARGPIIDQEALVDALHAGRIGGAALDVTDPEPPDADDPLWKTPNLLVVPHIGSATRAARERMTEIAVENLLAGLVGQPLPHQVPTQVANNERTRR